MRPDDDDLSDGDAPSHHPVIRQEWNRITTQIIIVVLHQLNICSS